MRLVGFIALFLFSLPTFTYAVDLININTADATLLDSLPHVGPSTAQKIIDYRNANGPFATIEDLQKVSGIGSGSNYADIAPLITVGNASQAVPLVASSTDTTASSTPPAATPLSTPSASTYAPPPSALTVTVSGSSAALLEVPLHLSARVTTKSGAVDTTAQIVWSWGDGSSSSGTEVEKVYHYAGTYLVTAVASDGATKARGELLVTVTPAAAQVSAVSGEGITIANGSADRLDLSGWLLSSGNGTFRIPEGMTILPQASALLPSIITNLPIAFDATLRYPNGVIADQYAPPVVPIATATPPVAPQPAPDVAGYSQVQEVEPIISTPQAVPTYDAEAVIAPVATAEPVATGAPVAAAGLLHSPWTLGAFGVTVLAAGAFILL
jgi:competence ComEA-like helix-hairpin-helix protein